LYPVDFNHATLQDNQPGPRKREERLSDDGKWRSFPKVPHLLQYVISGNYFGKVKINGKTTRQSLQTTVWSTAQLKLNDFLKENRENRNKIDASKFSKAVERFKEELTNDTTIKPRSKEYRLLCLQKIQTSWPELGDLRLDEITAQVCKEWSAKLNEKIAGHYFNNTIGTLRQVMDAGLKAHQKNGGTALENPAAELKRVKVKQKDLRLPEPSHFKGLIENIRKPSGAWGERTASLVEFLAYGGMRIRSEAAWVTWEDVDWQRREIIVRGDPVTATKNSEIRRVPILPDMEILLTRLKEKPGTAAHGRIMQVSECKQTLARACKEIGIPKLTHPDLRHLFATRCIESGVDIPTVSRWLGHKDGGALAMKTYGHLRNERSQAMAQKVKF
jgi:integrase